MTRNELDDFFQQYTPNELASLQGKKPSLPFDIYHKHKPPNPHELDQVDTYLFHAMDFIPVDEIIGVKRQDRFETVYPHMHNYIELNYIWSGSCTQYINGQKIDNQQGDICIFDTKAVHSVERAEQGDIIINLLMRKEYFAAAFISRMAKQGILSNFLINAVTKTQNNQHFLCFESHNNTRIPQIMEQVLSEYYEKTLGFREIIDSYMIILFTELLRTYRETHTPQESSDNRADLLKILEYIESHYASCTLTSTAEHFGFHPSYLTTLLKEKTGQTFLDHIQEQKLNKARFLLTGSNLSISEIIAESGYHNAHFFYQKFKEAENCTPADYRRQFSQRNSPHTSIP